MLIVVIHEHKLKPIKIKRKFFFILTFMANDSFKSKQHMFGENSFNFSSPVSSEEENKYTFDYIIWISSICMLFIAFSVKSISELKWNEF